MEMWGMYQLQKWCRNVSVVDAEMGGGGGDVLRKCGVCISC